MAGTIVVGYDGAEIAQRALARAIDEARKSSASLVVVAVAEMPLNVEGLQNFGTLDDSPLQMMPVDRASGARPDLRRSTHAGGGSGVDGRLCLGRR